jgi:hypothetical protein
MPQRANVMAPAATVEPVMANPARLAQFATLRGTASAMAPKKTVDTTPLGQNIGTHYFLEAYSIPLALSSA